jgi:hypothetical protein
MLWKPCANSALRFHTMATGIRSHAKWAMPSIMVIVCLALVVRGLPT